MLNTKSAMKVISEQNTSHKIICKNPIQVEQLNQEITSWSPNQDTLWIIDCLIFDI